MATANWPASLSADANSKCPRSAPLGHILHSGSHFHTIFREETFEGDTVPPFGCQVQLSLEVLGLSLLGHQAFASLFLVFTFQVYSVQQITTKSNSGKHNPKFHLPQSFTTWAMLMWLTKQTESLSRFPPATRFWFCKILLSVCPVAGTNMQLEGQFVSMGYPG